MTGPQITALILGAAVWRDGPSPTLRRRTLHAAGLYRAGCVSHLIPCGGLGRHPPSEAVMMRDLLISDGVPPDRITPEAASTTTEQNIRLALPILRRLGATRIIIVTDAPHAPRALLTARRLGLDASASWPSIRGARPLPFLRLALREIPAYLIYWWRVRP